MANQNLSQFTEKLFVADADHTFIWDTAASISKRVSRNSWLNSGTLTSDAPVTISQTWNNAAVAFTGLKVNAAGTSDANSASGSLLADFQVGGVSKFTVRKDGAIVLPFNYAGIVDGSYNSGGTNYTWGGPRFGPAAFIAWTAGAPTSTADTILLRDAPNTLALRNGANAQTFNVYGTYTSGTSYERLTLSAPSAANAIIGTNKGSGGGTARGLEFQTDGVSRWSISTAGHLLAAADNTCDIGASGASRPRNVYVASHLAVGTFATFGSFIYAENYYFSTTKGLLAAPSDGVFTFSNRAATDFTRLQFGGTTNLFPAIKRSSTTLQARLADDSAFAPIQGKLTTDTAFDATVVTPTGFITLYDSTGTAYKVPCVPA